MLFSTGLTIGIITLTFGKSAGYLNQAQFSIAMISVILSALIPTLLAKRFIPKKLGSSSIANPQKRSERSSSSALSNVRGLTKE